LHDQLGLQELVGKSLFLSRLDDLFALGHVGVPVFPLSRDFPIVLTLPSRQDDHSNEPSHHIPYIYSIVGKPWKTAENVRHIAETNVSDRDWMAFIIALSS
jgi:putative alpha-1,2-mannosidase